MVASSRTGATGIQAATDQLRSLSFGSPNQSSGPRTAAPYVATVSDQRTGLQTRWEVSATTQYTDPVNLSSNRGLNVKRIREVEGRSGKVSETPGTDYKAYRVSFKPGRQLYLIPHIT